MPDPSLADRFIAPRGTPPSPPPPICGGSGYDLAVLADSPVHYYPLCDALGASSVEDFSGSLNGTPHSGVAFGSGGIFGDGLSAATFDGTSNSNIGFSAGFGNGSEWTIEAQIYRTANPGGGVFTVGQFGRNIGARIQLMVFGPDSDNIHIGINSDASNPGGGGWEGTVNIPINTATIVAMTWDGTTLKFYVNGTLDSEHATTVVTPDLIASYIGAANSEFSSFNSEFVGKIAKVAYYGGALTAGELAAHFAARNS